MKELLKCLLVVAGIGFSLPAVAVPITVDGTDYNITTISGSFNANADRLRGQEWFGNAGLAEDLASASGGMLGLFPFQGFGDFGPLFALTDMVDNNPGNIEAWSSGLAGLDTSRIMLGLDDVVAWAVVEVETVPEPSVIALMVLGLAGIGFARRRKS